MHRNPLEGVVVTLDAARRGRLAISGLPSQATRVAVALKGKRSKVVSVRRPCRSHAFGAALGGSGAEQVSLRARSKRRSCR